MVADEALTPQCFTAHCTCKMAAMLTHETSELTDPDVWPPKRMAFRTSAVSTLLCNFTLLHESNLKSRFLHLLCTNLTVNMTKVVIKILQGSAVAETV